MSAEVVHLLNAYTWAGRRAECAVTSPSLNCVRDLSDIADVTCPNCLAAVSGGTP